MIDHGSSESVDDARETLLEILDKSGNRQPHTRFAVNALPDMFLVRLLLVIWCIPMGGWVTHQ